MNEGYRARRAAKHAAQKSMRLTVVSDVVGTIDLVPRGPRLAWLNGKTCPQGNLGRKGRSGHLPEHTQALLDNADFVPTPKAEPVSEPTVSPENGEIDV